MMQAKSATAVRRTVVAAAERGEERRADDVRVDERGIGRHEPPPSPREMRSGPSLTAEQRAPAVYWTTRLCEV
jgi:hypothetical protein